MLVLIISVAKFHCQISVTKVSELSNISNLCCIAKVSVTNNLRQRNIVRENLALFSFEFHAQMFQMHVTGTLSGPILYNDLHMLYP